MMRLLRVLFCAYIMVVIVNAMPEPKDPRVPFKFYSRQDWGAAPANDTVPLNTPVPYVVIHHTYIPGACHTFEECSRSMLSMQNYHGVTLDWGDIGYNFCVGSEGGAYEGRGWKTKGIHAGRANGISVGICLIGDWRSELPPSMQLETTKALIESGVEKGFIRPDYKLVGHRQVMSTECPGGALYEHISGWEHFSPTFVPMKA
ncbi:unnamed protein product [Chilo suppressalis]|uniref:Peptidoglycan-recognition protein n=1 Tax=Chilo suppressalis TaxID=168631 RepID=A0ABN8B897_CHISP|nr:hypothetical protein evm_007864 [Chilo suppressalis]CAH0402749.1 unnamed protein product [Chilo suppressalis]